MGYNKLFTTISFCFILAAANAQDSVGHLFSEKAEQQKINEIQAAIIKAGQENAGAESPEKKARAEISFAKVIAHFDSVKQEIYRNSILTDSLQGDSLKKFGHFLSRILSSIKLREIKFEQVPELLDGYIHIPQLAAHNNSIFEFVAKLKLPVARLLLKTFSNEEFTGLRESESYLVEQTYQKQAPVFFQTLFDFPNVPNADSLIVVAAPHFPEQLYIYSQALETDLGKKIADCPDSMVKLITHIAQMPAGRLYFPFLDDLYHKKLSLRSIQSTLHSSNNVSYFKLLVNTQINYKQRLEKLDTPVACEALQHKLKSVAINDFIYPINGLHDSADHIRLKAIRTLNARELYYICIAGVDELYTSSYLKIYNRLFSGKQTSFQLLQAVHFDQLKRFLKMASTFNTLDDFLSRMSRKQGDSIIISFLDHLDNYLNLEDAVDVADSYASITDAALRNFILRKIESKADSTRLYGPANGKRGIYDLLRILFLSLDPVNDIDVAQMLKIPPVYRVENNFLKDDSGRIVIQQFFYGDDDGRQSYNLFMRTYKTAHWKLTANQYWTKFSSPAGTPVEIYSNTPLDDNSNLDEFAQQMLAEHLRKLNRKPAILIHRGHSYHIKSTFRQLSPVNKLVFLGSCGGYANLKQVYDLSPYAHIIATKQDGSTQINQALLTSITDFLARGKNLDWPIIWKSLRDRFKLNGRFSDYIPPHQNLGAILLMAVYNQQEGTNDVVQ